jgi:hypothetical protein
MTGEPKWAVRDAKRLHRRLEHLAGGQHPPSPRQVDYVRRQVHAVLAADHELPDRWTADLRHLLRLLEEVTA